MIVSTLVLATKYLVLEQDLNTHTRVKLYSQGLGTSVLFILILILQWCILNLKAWSGMYSEKLYM